MSTTKRSRSGSRSSKKSATYPLATPGQIVKVLWHDAWGTSGWGTKDIADVDHAPVPVVTVGIVGKHDDVGISLAKGRDANGLFLGQGFIPAGMIQEVTILE